MHRSVYKRPILVLAALLCTLSLLTGCAVTQQPPETTAPTQPATEPITEPTAPPTQPIGPNKIGISMPTKGLQRWVRDGSHMKNLLEDLGYDVTLQFGKNEVDTQISQIENMIADGRKLLIITRIDNSLDTVLQKAKERGITVIAYDRLLMGTADVDHYITFDNFMVGQLQGQYIVDALDLEHAEGPFHIEFVEGDGGDGNIPIYFDGQMTILKPYIESGKLVVVSGQNELFQCTTEGYYAEEAQKRMEGILREFYADKPLHAVCCINDSTAQGVIAALENSYSGDIYPIVTGWNCNIPNVKYMLAGKQAMSVFWDTLDLAAQTVKMADDIMQGREPEINDTLSYNNFVKVIPTYLCAPVVVTTENYRERLLDSGYYAEEDLA